MRFHRAVLSCFAVILMAAATGCGSSAKPTARVTIPTLTSRPVSSTTVAKHSGANVTATDKDNGTTIAAKVGNRVDVVLGSTYWMFAPASDASVLSLLGTPVVDAQPNGCVPGQGCGTTTASYDAVAPGTAVVSASRTSCGEAMRCTGTAGSYRVTITVAP